MSTANKPSEGTEGKGADRLLPSSGGGDTPDPQGPKPGLSEGPDTNKDDKTKTGLGER